jgi:hypothetical protein
MPMDYELHVPLKMPKPFVNFQQNLCEHCRRNGRENSVFIDDSISVSLFFLLFSLNKPKRIFSHPKLKTTTKITIIA